MNQKTIHQSLPNCFYLEITPAAQDSTPTALPSSLLPFPPPGEMPPPSRVSLASLLQPPLEINNNRQPVVPPKQQQQQRRSTGGSGRPCTCALHRWLCPLLPHITSPSILSRPVRLGRVASRAPDCSACVSTAAAVVVVVWSVPARATVRRLYTR